MSVLDFFLIINCTKEKHESHRLNEILEKYKKFIVISMEEESDTCSFNISASYLTFFNSCRAIYTFCNDIQSIMQIIEIGTTNKYKKYDFKSEKEFIFWVYDMKQSGLEYFEQNFGMFVLKQWPNPIARKYIIKHSLKKQ